MSDSTRNVRPSRRIASSSSRVAAIASAGLAIATGGAAAGGGTAGVAAAGFWSPALLRRFTMAPICAQSAFTFSRSPTFAASLIAIKSSSIVLDPFATLASRVPLCVAPSRHNATFFRLRTSPVSRSKSHTGDIWRRSPLAICRFASDVQPTSFAQSSGWPLASLRISGSALGALAIPRMGDPPRFSRANSDSCS